MVARRSQRSVISSGTQWNTKHRSNHGLHCLVARVNYLAHVENGWEFQVGDSQHSSYNYTKQLGEPGRTIKNESLSQWKYVWETVAKTITKSEKCLCPNHGIPIIIIKNPGGFFFSPGAHYDRDPIKVHSFFQNHQRLSGLETNNRRTEFHLISCIAVFATIYKEWLKVHEHQWNIPTMPHSFFLRVGPKQLARALRCWVWVDDLANNLSDASCWQTAFWCYQLKASSVLCLLPTDDPTWARSSFYTRVVYNVVMVLWNLWGAK